MLALVFKQIYQQSLMNENGKWSSRVNTGLTVHIVRMNGLIVMTPFTTTNSEMHGGEQRMGLSASQVTVVD